jgi:predicted RND superfamily exporter protein
MNRYIDFALKRPILVLCILAIVTLILSPGMMKLEFDNSIDVFMPRNDEEYLYYNKVKEVYGDNGRFIIISVSDKNLWSPGTLRKMDELIRDLEEYKEYDEKKESLRLLKLDSLIAGGSLPYDAFILSFHDDPSFQRLLRRKTEVIFGNVEKLSRWKLKKLKKEISRSNDFKKQELIDEIIAPLTAQDITGKDDVLVIFDLVDVGDDGERILPTTAAEMTAFRKKLERNPAFEMGLYSRDKKTGEITDFGIIIKLENMEDQDPIARELFGIINSHGSLDMVTSGIPIVNIWAIDYMHNDLYVLVPIIMLVVMVIFYFNFRSLRGVILPTATLGLAELWLLGLMGYSGFRITSLALTLPPLIIAVGSSYSIHILNQYYADFTSITEVGKHEGLRRSMSHISLTVLLAGITTFIAFMTLATSQVTAIKEWGIASAIGVMFAVFISSSLIPAALSLLPHTMPRLLLRKDKTLRTTIVDRIIQLMTKGAVLHHRKVIVVLIIIMTFSIAGLFRLKVETVFLYYFKENGPVREAIHIIGEKFGGGDNFVIQIDSGEVDGATTPKFLTAIENLREWLLLSENRDLNIGRTDSFSDFIKTMHMAMNNDDLSFYKIPETKTDIIDYLELYAGDDDDGNGRFDEFEPFVDENYQSCNILARLYRKKDFRVGTTEISQIKEKIIDHLTMNLPKDYSFCVTGFPTMEVKLVYYVVKGQLQSLLLSLIVVGIIVMLLFSLLKAGVIALIPMSVAVILNFGIMGWLGINLDMATSIIAAITIGIGVDDTIHFLNNFRHLRTRGLSIDETISGTLAVSGKAILFTSLALILGFSVFTVSNFRPVILFGLLMAMTMIATTIGALLVLPTIIKATNIDLATPEKKSLLYRHLNLGKIFGLDETDSSGE